jgi:phosphopantothenoylcysteine decarboxylase/phosphopantothenate--cysteine ligase
MLHPTVSIDPLSRPTVVLGVCGSIAAYKAASVARLLVKAGVRVLPVMTRSAAKMLGVPTLAGITGNPVKLDMFDPSIAGELHVELAAQADLVAVVPATAELLSSLATGRAEDLLRATLLCGRSPALVAPAMHPRMWSHPSTQRNVATLRADGVEFVGPVVGEVASGEVGEGRMAEPEAIVLAILARLNQSPLVAQDFAAKHIVVTAGPTVEDVDPARCLSNRSSGKMGYALVEAALARGARVTLISGPVALPEPKGADVLHVRSAREMQATLDAVLGNELGNADALIMAAAVADYRPAEPHNAKLKRTGPMTLELLPNPDLLAELGARRKTQRPALVGFALETATGEDLVAAARAKLIKKRVDLVVANTASDAFDKDDNRIVLVTSGDALPLALASKRVLADRILDHLSALLP